MGDRDRVRGEGCFVREGKERDRKEGRFVRGRGWIWW
jgi:hypothetical protein